MNSILGSVVPLAMFFVFLLKISVLTVPWFFPLSVLVFFCFYFLYFCWRSLFWPRHKIVYSSINPISRTRKDCGNRLKGHRSIFSFWICTSSCVCILDFHIDLSTPQSICLQKKVLRQYINAAELSFPNRNATPSAKRPLCQGLEHPGNSISLSYPTSVLRKVSSD